MCCIYSKRELTEEEIFSLHLFYENLISVLDSKEKSHIAKAMFFHHGDNQFDVRILYFGFSRVGIIFNFDLMLWETELSSLAMMQNDLKLSMSLFLSNRLTGECDCAGKSIYALGKPLSTLDLFRDFSFMPENYRLDNTSGSYNFSYRT